MGLQGEKQNPFWRGRVFPFCQWHKTLGFSEYSQKGLEKKTHREKREGVAGKFRKGTAWLFVGNKRLGVHIRGFQFDGDVKS